MTLDFGIITYSTVVSKLKNYFSNRGRKSYKTEQ